jgi:glycosyltransferase involved in cell wall biosynthesis
MRQSIRRKIVRFVKAHLSPTQIKHIRRVSSLFYRLKLRKSFLFTEIRRAGKSERKKKSRGIILIVCHDANIGGAPLLGRELAKWLITSTNYDIRFLLVEGGPEYNEFASICPTLDLSTLGQEDKIPEVHKFCNYEDPKAVIINSAASASSVGLFSDKVTIIAYIHELRQVLEIYQSEVDQLRIRADYVFCGSQAVLECLANHYRFSREILEVAYSFIDFGVEEIDDIASTKKRFKSAIGVDINCTLIVGCGTAHWRKNPKLFVKIANEIVKTAGSPVMFAWIGGGPDLEECIKLASSYSIRDYIYFFGYQADVTPYLMASDIFLLTSEEDPFPLACLQAALSFNTIICFDDSGGVPELINSANAGISVPKNNIEKTIEAILSYIENDNRRIADACALSMHVKQFHTPAFICPSIFSTLREVAGLRPHVSVIVPNYNYAEFLPLRLQSICEQTYQDFEIILLDDYSTDASRDILQSFIEKRGNRSTIALFNEVNSESPFKQWIKGIQHASGDLIWIAESDDYCHPDLLSELVSRMSDNNVLMSWTQSVPVDVDSNVLGNYNEIYLDRINPGRWLSDYVCTDYVELSQGLGIANCIPNASSLVFKKFPLEEQFISRLFNTSLCGDWLFYLRAMRGGYVSYCSKPLNYHRRHARTVTNMLEGTDKYFEEFNLVKDYIFSTYTVDQALSLRMNNYLSSENQRFSGNYNPFGSNTQISCRLPSIMLVVSDLSPGGGQMFMIRLARQWYKMGGRVFLLNVNKYPDKVEVTEKIPPCISCFNASDVELSEIIVELGIDIIHSAIWWADEYILSKILQISIPWVVTLHGCYESLLENKHIEPLLESKVLSMIQNVDHWIYTADKNLTIFKSFGFPTSLSRIDNGMDIEDPGTLTRKDLNLADDTYLVCLASRAIPKKGWKEAIAAICSMRNIPMNIELLLIGDGPCTPDPGNVSIEGIHHIPHVSNLQDYLRLSDVVILPSYFSGESFPLVLIEAMALAKPIIGTDIGEISKLINGSNGKSGVLLPLTAQKILQEDLVAALMSLADPKVRSRLGANAYERYKEMFTLDHMANNYLDVYLKVINAAKSSPEKPSNRR